MSRLRIKLTSRRRNAAHRKHDKLQAQRAKTYVVRDGRGRVIASR